MIRGSALALALVLAVVACSAAAGLVGADPAATDGVAQQDIDADDVLLAIDVEDDGDAVWTVEYRTRLETEEDAAAFEDLRGDIENGSQPYVDRFSDRMNSTAGNAANVTGREMSISETRIEAERRDLPQEYGVVTYTFRWSNFAAVEGDRLRVGDAIDGLFLDEETTLLISWPDDTELDDASPSPSETREGSVVYSGTTNFAAGEPRIELGPPGSAPPAGVSSSARLVAVGSAIVLLVGGAVGVFAYRRRRESDTSPEVPDRDDAPASDQPPASDDDRDVDPELLSNEERVIRLIESEDGRMKQQEVAERLGWTDAKTSQVVTKLREEGDLEGFRLGRENVLSLPDDE
ncbi:helix-turn-helix transcriptional regulator [Natronomonas sp.]|uniref:helix-turn-helix transcriptional regulator n=1 Tax=Natronomonas sp. TaxID=2184060 RepID=UPI002633B907|nr:winged helix-turn-helix transcriptional regulator [Natronomonas sp.]